MLMSVFLPFIYKNTIFVVYGMTLICYFPFPEITLPLHPDKMIHLKFINNNN